MARIIVSFKRNEMDIYNIIKSQGDQSNYIKDAVKFFLKYKDNSNKPVKNENENPSEIMNILDF